MSQASRCPPADVTHEQRRVAKVINFGLIYGYFARFAGVKRYMDETRSSAKRQGYVETVFGRRLWLPEINSGNGPRRAGSERQAINAPCRGPRPT